MNKEQKKEESDKVCEEIQSFLIKKSPEMLVVYEPLSDELDITAVLNWYQNLEKNFLIIPQHPEREVLPLIPINSVVLVP